MKYQLIQYLRSMRMFGFVLLGLLTGIAPGLLNAQPEDQTYNLFLIGDCGEPDIVGHPIGDGLRQQASITGRQTTILYLGDNIYPKGMPLAGTKSRGEAELVLKTQTDWSKGLEARAIFVPGNHDWQQGGKQGWQHVRNQQQFIDSLKLNNTLVYPRDGCPGPVEIPLNDKAILIIIDTQWFLHRWDKPSANSDCTVKTEEELFSLLDDILSRHQSKRIIMAGHHPLISYGQHGGEYTLKDHLFPLTNAVHGLYLPLPIIGSLYPLYRKCIGSIQDTAHPVYRAFSEAIQKRLQHYPGSIYVSGHDHNLQYIVKDSVHYIVSGSGSKTAHAKRKGFSHFADDVTGFVNLKLNPDGSAQLVYWQVDEVVPGGKMIFTENLPAPATMP